ncbi:MAG: LysE family transporter [Anaerolineae bacterium]|nr:LysE family transporter [Phycisphaerae bacterium]
MFGIGAAAPIGPVNVEMARRALRHGFASGFALGCGAVTVDVTYAIVASLSVTRLLQTDQASRPWFYWPMTIAACGLLAFLGISSLRGARVVARADIFSEKRKNFRVKKNSHDNAQPAASSAGRTASGYVTGLLMTGLSPMTLAFWFVVLPKWAGDISQQPTRDLPIIVLGVFVATIGWVIGFSGLLSFAGRWRRRWWMIAADEFGGVMLLALALGALLRSFQ